LRSALIKIASIFLSEAVFSKALNVEMYPKVNKFLHKSHPTSNTRPNYKLIPVLGICVKVNGRPIFTMTYLKNAILPYTPLASIHGPMLKVREISLLVAIRQMFT
jgi:hypothetical protein